MAKAEYAADPVRDYGYSAYAYGSSIRNQAIPTYVSTLLNDRTLAQHSVTPPRIHTLPYFRCAHHPLKHQRLPIPNSAPAETTPNSRLAPQLQFWRKPPNHPVPT